jgi:hypothetical protein
MDQRAVSVYDFRDRNDRLSAHLSDSETQQPFGEMVRGLIKDNLAPHPAEASMAGHRL